ncbi:MAG: glycosyltransferase [Bellilinea sp.]
MKNYFAVEEVGMSDSTGHSTLMMHIMSLISSLEPKTLFVVAPDDLTRLIQNLSMGIPVEKMADLTRIDTTKTNTTGLLIIETPLENAIASQVIDLSNRFQGDLLLLQAGSKENGGGITLPEIITGLISKGFNNRLDIPPTVDDYYIAHLSHGPAPKNSAAQYELSIWQLAELSTRQRQLLIQLRREDSQLKSLLVAQQEQLVETQRKEMIRRVEIAEEQKEFWKTKWQAFEASRSWRFLGFLQKVKSILFSPIRLAKKIIHLFKLSLMVIRTQGLRRFMFLAREYPKNLSFNKKRKLRGSGQIADRSRMYEIDAVEPPPTLIENTEMVDIIICIHNALNDVKACLQSVLVNTAPPYHIILVDDGSNEETKNYLIDFQQGNPSLVSLIRSEQPTGYTFAANRGLKASTAPFVILLNSDTIATPQWVVRLVACMKHQPRIGIVGPLSNTASWQSVPLIEDNGDWANNLLPFHVSVDKMGEIIAENSARLYPFMPLLNGFCLLINRELINEIGYFDEENFGPGYGEEDDFVLRARKANWKTFLADDVYVYHAQSRSYSSERRKALSERAGKVLRNLHGENMIHEGVLYCSKDRVLEGIRARTMAGIEQDNCIAEGSRYQGKRILFILPVSSPGGGANVVIFESLAMMKMGVQIDFYNLEMNRGQFEEAYPDLPIHVIYGNITDLKNIIPNYDAVVATYNPSVGWIKKGLHAKSNPIVGYYVQGYEPLMYPEGSFDYEQAVKSYSLIPNMVRFTKTQWTRQTVMDNTGMDCEVAGISVNLPLFRPRPRKFPSVKNQPIRIMAMIRPEAAYRQPAETMQVLKLAADKYGSLVDICIFGTDLNNPGFADLPREFPWRLYGVLPQQKVASLLNEADIFIDFSSHQAMGLTALEAMACGAAVIVPQNGGAVEFARHEKNSLIFTTNHVEAVWQALQRLIEDDSLRKEIQRSAIYDSCQYYPEKPALNILKALFGEPE